MAEDLTGVAEGDKLMVTGLGRGSSEREVTVSRVGRDYLYVADAGGRELRQRFLRKTGTQDKYTGIPAQLYTVPEYWKRQARATASMRLLGAGVRIESDTLNRLTTDQLHAILDIVTSGQD